MDCRSKFLISDSSSCQTKRSKLGKWTEKKHAGMKIFIVVAIFAVLGLIILSEFIMIDEDGEPIPYGEVLPLSVELTLPPYPVGVLPSDESWKIVNGSLFKFFVFSAYHDSRGAEKVIRVIGATKTQKPEKVWCRFWYPIEPNNSTYRSSSVMAKVKIIRENWDLKYSACFILCPLASGLEIPYAVSIVKQIRSPPGNVLLLRNNELSVHNSTDEIPDKIAVCVKPFHYDYDSALILLEFLELYSLLGVSHFTFYNHTLGPKADCVLRNYIEGVLANDTTQDENEERPTVSMLPWDLNMLSQKEIRTEGLFASFNDCLYRSMYRFKYVAFVDVDEFIVPRQNDTLKDLLKWLPVGGVKGKNVGAYSFQNAFFYLQFADDSLMTERQNVSNAALRAELITQRKTRRRSELNPHRQRSKYICRPEGIVEAGNHFIWEYMPHYGALHVQPDAAILHHYRVCEFGGDDCVQAPSTVDRTAHRYASRLTDRVDMMYNKLKQRCNLLDLPSVPTKGAEELNS